MGILDSIKDLFRGKGDTAKDGIDKAADFADDKTGGQHTEHIDKAADAAKDVVDKIDPA